jgi:thymidine kinase
MAKLHFHYATMNAGKKTMLLQASYNYRERGMHTMLFVAGHYRKKEGGGYVSSRNFREASARPADVPQASDQPSPAASLRPYIAQAKF